MVVDESFVTPCAKALHTMTHEIGHIMIGPGHPDESSKNDRGVAPLPGTRHVKRLMASGTINQVGLSSRLVKGEWDMIQGWLPTWAP